MPTPEARKPLVTTRRVVLALAGAGAAAAVLGRFAFAGDPARPRAPAERLVALTPREAALVEAIGARIWPGTPADPGAREAGTVHYIDRALGGPYAAWLATYRRVPRQIDLLSWARHTTGFVELDEAKQDAMIASLEAGTLVGVDGGGRDFFRVIRVHTMEGVFADPAYGGNRALVGWKAVRYPGPFYTITAAEQQSFGPHRMRYRGIRDL